MSTDEKPLHVRVAEALGTFHKQHEWDEPDWRDRAFSQGCTYACGALKHEPCAPRYDTDWAATGPLVEKYQLRISPFGGSLWEAWVNETAHGGIRGPGRTPLEAICNLLLALHAAGKLKEAA